MQVSIKWLNDYIKFNETAEELADKYTMSGVPVENVIRADEGLDVQREQRRGDENHRDALSVFYPVDDHDASSFSGMPARRRRAILPISGTPPC